MKTNKEIFKAAKNLLWPNYGQAVLAVFIAGFISYIPSATGLFIPNSFFKAIFSLVISIFISAPVSCGLFNSFRLLCSDNDGKIYSNTFRIAFGNNYFRFIGGSILVYLIIVLGCILFIVPGIIWALAYSLTPFILKDNPELSVTDALSASRNAMKGKKAKLFGLLLSIMAIPLIFGIAAAILLETPSTGFFIGGYIAGLAIAAVLFFFGPLSYIAISHFYLEVKAEA